MLAVFAAAILASAAPAREAMPRPALFVVTRQETASPLPEAVLRQIAAETRDIWRPYVDVDFSSGGGVRQRFDAETLDLVVTDRVSGGEGDGLGWIGFVDGAPTRTITISRSEVTRLFEEGKWAGRRLTEWPTQVRQNFTVHAVARAIAHEIGHYVLASKAHAASGLMRAGFSVDEIMEAGHRRYRLDAGSIARLNARVTPSLIAGRPPASAPVQ